MRPEAPTVPNGVRPLQGAFFWWNMNGWWRFHREMLEHPVWSLPGDQLKVWLAICSQTNWTDKEWFKGSDRILIKKGSFVTTQDHLSDIAGVGRQTVRTSIKNLIRLKSISTNVLTNRFTIITVVNWTIYNDDAEQTNQQTNQQLTNDQPTANQPLTTTKEVKKEIKKEETSCEADAPRNGHEARDVLAWLNLKAGKNFEPSKTNLDFIRCRLKEGITAWQLRAVIAQKVRKWGTDEKMKEYLRPATLFNRAKCHQYVGELPKEDGHGMP
jgi:uncharacterized phage protein (TIGR02220 family)